MNLSYSELIQCCINVLDTYQSESVAVDHHLELFFKEFKSLDDVDQTFIVEIFTGCVRFSQVLDVVVDGYFNSSGKSVLPSERNLYKVIVYLILFRLEELGIQHFAKFVNSQNKAKMHKFLTFFLDEVNITTWIKDGWNALYDSCYVDLTILFPLCSSLPKLQKLLKNLEMKMEREKIAVKCNNQVTEVKPFNLTKQKPVSIPMPQRIPKMAKHRPVPKSTYGQAACDKELMEAKLKNWQTAQDLYTEMQKYAPACSSKTGKSEKTLQRMEMIVNEQNNRLNFNQSHYTPPSQSSVVVPIKLNTAAILREGRLYQKREEEVIKKMESLEAGARDDSTVVEWQAKMKEQDMQRKMEEIEMRRLDGKLSQEEAIMARQRAVQEKRDTVAEMKVQAARLMNIYMIEKLAEEEQAKKLVQTVMTMEADSRKAKLKLQQYKAKIVQEMQDEMRELMRQALEEAEIEMKQKLELIHQIREMESGGRAVRQKFVDLTETAGYGLLSEMSIVELRERLKLVQMEEITRLENKRDEIVSTKQMKDQMLLDTLDVISKHRNELSKAAAIKLEGKKRAHLEQKRPSNETIMEMEQRIREKKAQRLKDQTAMKVAPDKYAMQRLRERSSAKSMSEERRWCQVEQGGSAPVTNVAVCQSPGQQLSSSGRSRVGLLAM